MSVPDQEQDLPNPNQKIVAALRDQFALMTQRLRPEIEPAPIYSPHIRLVASEEGTEA